MGFSRRAEYHGGSKATTKAAFLRSEQKSIMSDFLVLIVIIFRVVVENEPHAMGKNISMRAILLWILTILVDHVIERKLFFKQLGWNILDLLICAFVFWSFVSYSELTMSQQVSQTFDPEATLFLVSQGNALVFPFSLVLSLAFFRLLRYLDVFPSITVPWRTFTRLVFILNALSSLFQPPSMKSRSLSFPLSFDQGFWRDHRLHDRLLCYRPGLLMHLHT